MTRAQYITDNDGKRISVIISLQEYETMRAAMEELADIVTFDAIKENPQDYMNLDAAFQLVEQKRRKNAVSSSH